MDFDQGQVRVTTLPAHRLLWLAGREGVQAAVGEALFRAHFVEGRNLADPQTLIAAACRRWHRRRADHRAAGRRGGACRRSRRSWPRPRPWASSRCPPSWSMTAMPSRAPSRRRPSPRPCARSPRTCPRHPPRRRAAVRRWTAARKECRPTAQGRGPVHAAFCDNAAVRHHGAPYWRSTMLVIGVAGTELTAQERDWLQHDAVAGVILFKRNFASRAAGGRAVGGDPRRRAAPAADLRGPGRRARAALPRGLQRAAAVAGLRCPVRAGPAGRAGAGRTTCLADGQRSARQWRGPELRPGGRPGPWQPAPSATAPSAPTRRSWPRSPRAYVRGHAQRRHGRHPQAFPRPRHGARRHPFRRSPPTRARWTNCARWTWCRSRPASTPAPMR